MHVCFNSANDLTQYCNVGRALLDGGLGEVWLVGKREVEDGSMKVLFVCGVGVGEREKDHMRDYFVGWVEKEGIS